MSFGTRGFEAGGEGGTDRCVYGQKLSPVFYRTVPFGAAAQNYERRRNRIHVRRGARPLAVQGSVANCANVAPI